MNKLQQSKQFLLDYINSGITHQPYRVYGYPKLRISETELIPLKPSTPFQVKYKDEDIVGFVVDGIDYTSPWTQLKLKEWIKTNFTIITSKHKY